MRTDNCEGCARAHPLHRYHTYRGRYVWLCDECAGIMGFYTPAFLRRRAQEMREREARP